MERIVNFDDGEILAKRIDMGDYDEDDYMIAHVKYMSDEMNSHHINVTEEVLRESAPSVLGKWVTAEVVNGDCTTHTDGQVIVGIVPKDQDVEFVERTVGENTYHDAYVDCIISKRYAKEYCDVFSEDDNRRNVSIEAVFTLDEDEINAVSFDIKTITTLGKNVLPSVKGANIEIVRFSEDEAEKYYSKFAKNESDVSHPTDSSDDGAKENKESDLRESDGKETEMSKEIEFAAVNLDSLWSAVYSALREKSYEYAWCMNGLYEEDNQKFAILKMDSGVLYRVDFKYTEDGVELAEEMTQVAMEFVEKDNVQKFACPEDCEYMTKFAEKDEDKEGEPADGEGEPKEEKMSEEDMMTKIAQLEKDCADKDNIIMEKDTELSELRAYKEGIECAKVASCVDTLMASVKSCLSEEQFAEFAEEGKTCSIDTVDAWQNKVKAFCFDKKVDTKKVEKGEVFSFAAPKEEKQEHKSVWDRI